MSARLEVITGPMFSGKSATLIQLLENATYAKKQILVIKPALDNRSGQTEITTRKIIRGRSTIINRFPAHSINSLKEFRKATEINYFHVLGIEEGQFLGSWIIRAVAELLNERAHDDLRIIIAGLDMTANMEPFGSMPQLLAMADEVIKLHAVCFKCGKDARYTQKLGGTTDRIQVGDLGLYEARCRPCHTTNVASS